MYIIVCYIVSIHYVYIYFKEQILTGSIRKIFTEVKTQSGFKKCSLSLLMTWTRFYLYS